MNAAAEANSKQYLAISVNVKIERVYVADAGNSATSRSLGSAGCSRQLPATLPATLAHEIPRRCRFSRRRQAADDYSWQLCSPEYRRAGDESSYQPWEKTVRHFNNAVTFAARLCCRKFLTNNRRAVVKGGAGGLARGFMRRWFSIIAILVVCLCGVAARAGTQVNVTQEHNNPSRDGVYIDAAFTPSAAANLTRDLNFNGTISGNVYAQPLYIEGGPNGPMIIAVTELNNVYALDATTGLPIWSRTDIGPPVPTTPCGGFNPTGITGTPVVDLTSRRLFFDALINGSPTKHFVYSLDVDTGATTPGWPVDVNATASYNGINFVSFAQEERGGLALVNGIVYVSYSGYVGDCNIYHGWVVGVDINSPSNVGGWATTAMGGGIWGHGGVASDGTNMFVVTGNTLNTGGNWMGGEAIIRLQAGPTWTGQPTDYWAPTNWFSLDNSDTDLGGVSATVVDVPGATPSQLVLALGKDSNAYLLDRNNLGGITSAVAQANVSGINRGTSAVTYHTSQGTYIGFHNDAGTMRAYKITAANPPQIVFAWSQNQNGRGSPWVTTTDGTNNTIIWVRGHEWRPAFARV